MLRRQDCSVHDALLVVLQQPMSAYWVEKYWRTMLAVLLANGETLPLGKSVMLMTNTIPMRSSPLRYTNGSTASLRVIDAT